MFLVSPKWFALGPLGQSGGKPITLAVPITEGTTRDGFRLGLLCEVRVRIWDPDVFCETVLPRGGFLRLEQLSGLVRERATPGLLRAISGCSLGATRNPWFEAYLRSSVNIALSPLGLRVAWLRLRSLADLGGLRSLEEVMRVLSERLPLPLSHERARALEEKLRELEEKPWLRAKPSDPSWAREWREFWAQLALDWMWARGRFILGPGDLDQEPFSAIPNQAWRREILSALARRLRALKDGRALSVEILDELCSSLARWALENGLYRLGLPDLMSLLGLGEDEARAVLARMVELGFSEWLEPGEEVLVNP